MKLVVEGGATKTVGVLEDGTRHTVGPTNLHVVGVDGVYKNLKKLLGYFKQKPTKYYFYISGLKSKKDISKMKDVCRRLNLKGKIVLGHDLLGGLLRESPDGTGIIVVSGTGSAVYGRNKKGEEAQVGGMGEKLGDEAGAYNIALAGMRAAIRSYDGRGPKTILEKKFGRIEDLTDWVEGMSKTEIAKLAPIVFKAVEKGDKVACGIIDNAVDSLVEAVRVVEKKIGPQKIVLSGGNFEYQPMFREKFVQKLDIFKVDIFKVRPRIFRGLTLKMVEEMIEGDRGVVEAVARQKDNIAKAIEEVVNAFRRGGRLFYVGTGTSGRIAEMDAVECDATFSVKVRAITKGAEEDSPGRVVGVTAKDVVIGVSASGTTQFVISALRDAKKKGAYTVLVTSGEKRGADLVIRLDTGPEIIEGSTRLKAGTAAKMVLNMISTISMIKLGKTYRRLMIDVRPKNKKLIKRAVGIISNICGIGEREALRFLRKARFNTRKAVRMGLWEKIKPMLMFGFNKDRVPKDAGSVIIFDRNVKYLKRFKRLFMSIDQEGGMVNRIKKGVTILPAPRYVKTAREAYRWGEILAKDLCKFGIRLDLAPVVDVNTEPTNPIIGERSFGDDTERVSRLGSAMIRGMQENGLLACAKHFPGHGPTKRDSHKCLPKVDISYREWQKIHLPPFIEAIKAGVACIMPGHILYPALDKEYPTSLSYKVITGILRERLGFKGLIITDDLGMGAITKHYTPQEAAVLAINAGADILCVCKGTAVQKKIRDAIVDAILDDRISIERINESVKRISNYFNLICGRLY